MRSAIRAGLIYFNDKVWEITGSEGATKLKDTKIVRCQWVLCNKGDAVNPDVRALLAKVNTNGTKEDS